MKIACFGTKSYDREFIEKFNTEGLFGHQITFFEPRLTEQTAVLAHGFDAVCIFVNDVANSKVLHLLRQGNVKLVLLRCAGFNNVDLEAAAELGMTVLRVPAYSPFSVAEHALAMILCLNRHLHKAYIRVREGNFALEGLLGFDLATKTVGIIGTGKIGYLLLKSLKLGFGCKVVAYDVIQNEEVKALGVPYVTLDELLTQSDIISLHVPLLPTTKHMINTESIAKMKNGVMLINTSRGGLVDTKAVIEGLKSKRLSAVGLDVYEEEGDIFFEDLSNDMIQDDTLARLTTFPNVLVTGHQAFFTATALEQIAKTTLQNATDFVQGKIKPGNEVKAEVHLSLSAKSAAGRKDSTKNKL